jgi:hypothetical protein
MADLPISGLTASASNAAATDVLPVVQTTGTGPVKMTVQQMAGGLLGSTTISGATVTTSQPVLNLAQTWSASGVKFTGLNFNAIDTTSNAASCLIDLQVGGTSKFVVDKAGRIRGDSSTNVQAYISFDSTAGGGPIIGNVATGLVTFAIPFGYIGVHLCNTVPFGFVSTANASSGTLDTILTRRGAANLRLGNADTTGTTAPTPQFLSAQSWLSSTTFNQTGANFTIDGSQGTGTGAGGSIVFRVAPAGGTSNGVQNGLSAALTINTTGQVTISGQGTNNNALIITDASAATKIVLGVPAAAGNLIYASSTGDAVFRGANANMLFGVNGAGDLSLGLTTASSIQYTVLPSTGRLVWNNVAASSAAGITTSGFDLQLARDDANTLALRNGTAAQAFNIYNTYTSSTSFERYSVDWITTANLVIVGPNKGSGGGTQRVQRLSYLEDGGAGSTVPLLGSTCPAASGTVKSWIKVITSDGTTAYVPCWA